MMKLLRKYKISIIAIGIPVSLFVLYKILLSFKITTQMILMIILWISVFSGMPADQKNGSAMKEPNWYLCFEEKNYWSKHENQSILAYEIDKNDPNYEQKKNDLYENVSKKTSTLGRKNTIDLADKTVFTYHQYIISEDQAEKYSSYPKTLRLEWDDQKTYMDYGFKPISIEDYCKLLNN